MTNNVDYVSFECVHMADADSYASDEIRAGMYADIDGYPEDENAQGTVICRVYMFCDGKYLVNWHHNGYRERPEIMELIEQAKKDLKDYAADKLENLIDIAYRRYRVKWMYEKHHTLDELLKGMQQYVDGGMLKLDEVFEQWEYNTGFSGEMWPDKLAFKMNEWEDGEIMKYLLKGEEYLLWFNRKIFLGRKH